VVDVVEWKAEGRSEAEWRASRYECSSEDGCLRKDLKGLKSCENEDLGFIPSAWEPVCHGFSPRDPSIKD
jgi:hypothetical protein